jgi:hypothetical protein
LGRGNVLKPSKRLSLNIEKGDQKLGIVEDYERFEEISKRWNLDKNKTFRKMINLIFENIGVYEKLRDYAEELGKKDAEILELKKEIALKNQDLSKRDLEIEKLNAILPESSEDQTYSWLQKWLKDWRTTPDETRELARPMIIKKGVVVRNEINTLLGLVDYEPAVESEFEKVKSGAT